MQIDWLIDWLIDIDQPIDRLVDLVIYDEYFVLSSELTR